MELKRTILIIFFIFISILRHVIPSNNFYTLLGHQYNINYSSNCEPNNFANELPEISYEDKMAQFKTLNSKSPREIASYFKSEPYLETTSEKDPMEIFSAIINEVLFGASKDDEDRDDLRNNVTKIIPVDTLAHFPSGQVMRAELFENKSAVHLPCSKFIQLGHSYLQITKDRMQTALNAFAIFTEGSIEDVLRLPPLYVLRSTRTISMMKIAREKMVATWTVIKGNHETDEITHQTLEMYRPLFKYLNGREISKLNLSDDRILSYIGTHAELNRHQVGIVASKYMELNRNWNTPKYLNLMNNLICGVPLFFMRRLSEYTYLQLSHQLFHHIRSCDPLQRRFYLHLMTRTQVLGKSDSWSASDVARLGLLLTEVDTEELIAINPIAMSGISAQVLLEMDDMRLKHLTETQIQYIAHKPLNILAKKLRKYQDELQILR